MKRTIIAASAVLIMIMLLCGCDAGGSYTDELKREYEDDVQEALEARLAEEGAECLQWEIYAPGGLTKACTGRFRRGGDVVQFVYDCEADVLYASSTRRGYGLSDAREDVAEEIESYLKDRGLSLESVRSISWSIPVTEYVWQVSSQDGKRKASGEPHVGVRWIACPYLDYRMSDGAAREYVSGLLHGFSDGFNGLSVALRCADFEDPGVQEEILDGWAFLKVFSGVDTVLLYRDDSDDVYYELVRNKDGTVACDRYEKVVSGKSGGSWRKIPVAMRQD